MQTAFSEPRPDWARLLGRAAAESGPILIPQVEGRRILVTGAGGFIASEMVRILAASGAGRIVLLENAEQKLFELHAEMEARGAGDRCIPILGSVCDRGLLADIFEEERPEMVLHTAALKHVPLMERNPLAAVETNSLGTWRLAEVAARYGVEQMILVSTDKAVKPHSIMGASKRIAELVMLAHPQRGTVVRLANVLGSPCSVGPVFAEQIARGGPITVTHPDARRFFLTLAEVADLIAQAMGAEAAGILVPDPGEPLLITDLAQRMIAARGRDVPVTFTGLRPGDKLDESLISAHESLDGQAAAGLRRVISPSTAKLPIQISHLQSAVAERDRESLLRIVCELVPDYQPGILLREAAPEAARP